MKKPIDPNLDNIIDDIISPDNYENADNAEPSLNKADLKDDNEINFSFTGSADIPETADTLEGNALLKARYIFENYHLDCFADDTGLEVEALNGAPGVYSARYAGDAHNSEANMQKLLQDMEGMENRKARFRTVFALIVNGKEHLFEGIVKGEITKHRHGTSGFGYDPVFIPEGYTQTYAEMGSELKNKISHRAVATDKLCNFLSK